jgi:MinD superfamily P-loop ATPase
MEEEKRKMSDMEIAMRIAKHIENPCGIVIDGKEHNIRNFYLREAKKLIPTLDNPYAKGFLEAIMRKYE